MTPLGPKRIFRAAFGLVEWTPLGQPSNAWYSRFG